MIKTKFLLICILLSSTCNQTIESKDYTIENIFTDGIEGPATDQDGNLYAVNYGEQGTIGITTLGGHSSLFIKLPKGSIGNGIRFGKKKQMFVADYTQHNILEINTETKKISVYAHESEANQPNDIAITPDNTLYASDPNWSNNTGNLWKITKAKGFELLESNMGTTNGIEVSPEADKLYVNESVQRKIWVYDITKKGFIENKKELIHFKDFGLDGMRCDKNGNLFVCRYGKGTVAVVSPEGRLIKEIHLKGKNPTNLTFNKDYDKCYVTLADRGCIEVIEL